MVNFGRYWSNHLHKSLRGKSVVKVPHKPRDLSCNLNNNRVSIQTWILGAMNQAGPETFKMKEDHVLDAIANDLEVGFQILWYEIKSVLGRGGFGVTYLTKDTNLNQLVAIKEYLPLDFASRDNDSTVRPKSARHNDIYAWGLDCFMSEAQTLANFKHSNIVRVLSVFKHNNTGYMVMEYEQGRVLSDIYENKKKLTQTDLEHYYFPVMEGLKAVHAEGFIHRDIKPENIYIRNNNSPVLLDFGAARQAVGGKTKTLTAMLSAGYAPFEQYHENMGNQGPWTDIYSLGACLLQGITGQKPMESTMRGMAVLHKDPDPYYPLSFSKPDSYSRPFLRAIDEALMLQIHERPQSLEDFISMLHGDIELPNLTPGKFGPSNRDKTVVRPNKRAFPVDGGYTKNSEKIPPAAQTKSRFSANHSLLLYKTGTNVISPVKIALIGICVLSSSIAVALQYPFELSQEEKVQQQVAPLLEKADVHFEANNYFSPQTENAITVYNEVLALDPQNRAATEALGIIGNFYLRKAEIQVEKYDFIAAALNLEIVNTISLNFPGLESLQARLLANKAREKALIEEERLRKAEEEKLEKEKVRLAQKAEEIQKQQEELTRIKQKKKNQTEKYSPPLKHEEILSPEPPKMENPVAVKKISQQKSNRERSKTVRKRGSKEERLRKIGTRS